MRVLLVVWAMLAAVMSGGEPGPSWRPSAFTVRPSDVALMPEGTPPDYAAFAPVRATLMVWGEEGLPALDGGEAAMKKLRANTAAYRRLGIREIATNLWMLTATERHLHAHPELGDASCVDLWGRRIVPRWLSDADFEGTKAWWGCTNQPRYQEHLLARLRAGLAAGATMVHLDDHSGTYACAAGAGGCFCAECRRGFREWLARETRAEASVLGGQKSVPGGHAPPQASVPGGHAPPRKSVPGGHASAGGTRPPGALMSDLRRAGIDPQNLARFDYAEFLRANWEDGQPADRERFIKASWAHEIPLWSWFLAYQREAALGFVARIRTEAAAILQREVPVGVNAYNLDPKQLFDAAEIDYFANEVEHWDQEDLIAPLAYRLGEALGRPTFVTGSGDDWIAYRKAGATRRVRSWIAQAYAFGQYFMYSWNKWGYSDETGTLWTQVPTTVYEPFTSFVRDRPELFDGMENVATVALVYDNATANRGKWQVREASKALLDAGVPYRLLVRGDDVLRFPEERVPASMDSSRPQILVVPSDVERTPAVEAWFKRWERAGARLAGAPRHPETAGRQNVAESASDSGFGALSVRIKAPGRVWALPRARIEGKGNSEGPRAVVHLLNREYVAEGDTFRTLPSVEVAFTAELVGGLKPRTAVYHAPGEPAASLEVKLHPSGRYTVVVPALEIWGVIALD